VRITAEMYQRMPEETSRAIEIVDGYIAYCEAPTPQHQLAARRLAKLIERAARRTDVVLYRCLDEGERLRADHVQLVIEIVSPGSQTTDEVDKPGEYARRASLITGSSGTSTYKHVGTLMKDEPGSAPVLANPIPVTIEWEELEY